MKLFVKSFIFLAYLILLFPYQTSSASITLSYEKEMSKIKVIANKVIQCESEGKHNVWGDLTLKYPVYGIAQFQQGTFYWLANISGNKGFRWKNKEHQIKLLNWALLHGHGRLWTCYRWYKRGMI